MKNMKKALLDQMMLGFILLMAMVAFVATSIDERDAKDEVYDLKFVMRTAAKAATKYYNDPKIPTPEEFTGDRQAAAESIANNIINQMPLGTKILDDVVYDWNAGTVLDQKLRVSISGYQKNNFWYKYFGKDYFTIGASAIQDYMLFGEQSPFAIPGCDGTEPREFSVGETISFTFHGEKGFNLEGEAASDEIYTLTTNTLHVAGNSDFAHTKLEINQDLVCSDGKIVMGGDYWDGEDIGNPLRVPFVDETVDYEVVVPGDVKIDLNGDGILDMNVHVDADAVDLDDDGEVDQIQTLTNLFVNILPDGTLVRFTFDGETTVWKWDTDEGITGDFTTTPYNEGADKEQDVNPKQLYQAFCGSADDTMYIAVTKCESTPDNVLIDYYIKVQLTIDPTYSKTPDADGYEQTIFTLKILETNINTGE